MSHRFNDSKKKSPHQPQQPKPELRPGSSAEKAGSRTELEVLRQKTVNLATQKPEKTARILSDWINKSQSGTATRKKTG